MPIFITNERGVFLTLETNFLMHTHFRYVNYHTFHLQIVLRNKKKCVSLHKKSAIKCVTNKRKSAIKRVIMYKRKIENILQSWLDDASHKPLVVKGVRQCGMTSSVMDFAQKHFKHVVYLDFREHPDYKKFFSPNLEVDSIIMRITAAMPNAEIEPDETCFVFDEEGRQIAKHRKVHLFDVDLPGMRFHESHTFTPGEAVTTFETRFGTMGAAICFDLRFPELFRSMAVRGAKVIFLPAQFNMTTGPAHWEMSLRSRAVDNEFFVLAAAAARYEGFSYECWGHSTVVDPYGSVIATCDETEQILYAGLDLNRIDEVRQQLPTFLHLRRDVYGVTE